MLTELGFAIAHWKLVAAGTIGFASILADANVSPGGWEDYSLKGLLLAAVLYLVREIRLLNKEGKESLSKTVDACTTTMQELKASTDVQTTYFRQVAQTIIAGSVQTQADRKEDRAEADRMKHPHRQ